MVLLRGIKWYWYNSGRDELAGQVGGHTHLPELRKEPQKKREIS